MQSDPRALADVLQISRAGTSITHDASRLAEARAAFAASHAVVLKAFLAPPLLDWVRERVSRGTFSLRVHAASGEESCMAPNEALWLLSFLVASPEVFAAVETVTGIRPLTKVDLRIYQFEPGEGHHHLWHDDYARHRLLGLSVNLSGHEFEGGNLQLRESPSERLLADIRNTGPGDAVIFRLGDDIEHQVLPTSGAHRRVALAGWFLSA